MHAITTVLSAQCHSNDPAIDFELPSGSSEAENVKMHKAGACCVAESRKSRVGLDHPRNPFMSRRLA